MQSCDVFQTTPSHFILFVPDSDNVKKYAAYFFAEVGESLTKTTDQLVESAHQYTDKCLVRGNYVVKDVTSSQHGDKLLRGILPLNSYNAADMGLSFTDPNMLLSYHY